jgi:hypothetical protein
MYFFFLEHSFRLAKLHTQAERDAFLTTWNGFTPSRDVAASSWYYTYRKHVTDKGNVVTFS